MGLDLCHPQDLTTEESQARPVFAHGDDETLYDPLYAKQCMFSDWCAAANITTQMKISYRNLEKVFYKGFARWVFIFSLCQVLPILVRSAIINQGHPLFTPDACTFPGVSEVC